MTQAFPLPESDPASLDLDPLRLDALEALIARHMADGRFPGAQIAMARHGKLALFRSFGRARTEGAAMAVDERTLFLLYSQTKVLTSATVWTLIEDGALSPMDRIADHLPEFAARGKADITLHLVMSHQGGFPGSEISQAAWADHARFRADVCDFSLEWTPGTRMQYHGRAAHQVQAMLIEAVTGQDYREVIRERIIAPLGLADDIFVGVPEAQQHRCADAYGREAIENSAAFRAAGLPHAGGYATARGIAAFYQALLAGGRLGRSRVLSPRMIAYGTRNHTGEMGDAAMDGTPMHRGLGPHVRGESERIRGLGTIGSPRTFGHGGVGSSYSWGDPDSGVSFTYLTNYVQPDPWHTLRLDRVSNIAHAAIL
ncbi:MAG: beta-lactamase family protein [Rhodospirillales bacterium]|nr:beta-lactamase family protein [Rhodospirillales bacterium]